MKEKQVLDCQTEYIVNYFRESETNEEDFKIGAEFEHVIIEEDSLETVGFHGDDGVQSTLRELLTLGWIGDYEGDYLMGLHKEGNMITLEPGAQVELSLKPYKNIRGMEDAYLNFLKDIVPILRKKKQSIMAIGYHPLSKIQDIGFIPKERYKYMADYLGGKGKHAHNMMKGTASMQVAIDFSSEADYIKKFRVTNALATIISAVFDNSPFLEGEAWMKEALRTHIWLHCDGERCGVVAEALDGIFGYKDYARYLLNGPPILVKRNGEFIFTKEQTFKEIFDPATWKTSDFEHICTMFFPDVRTKNFIEIRMADAVPYPLNFSGVALWKGLLYSHDNLEKLYRMTMTLSNEDIKKQKKAIVEQGIDAQYMGQSMKVWGLKLIELAKNGLSEDERSYLEPLEQLLKQGVTMAQRVKEKALISRHQALETCNLNRLI